MTPLTVFGGFIADRTGYRVLEGGRELDLTPKLLDLLFCFLDRPARLVTKEELLDAVWPGANVTDNALAQAISDLRDALGDSPSDPKYILTVARRGYRFIAPIEMQSGESPASAVPPRTAAAATAVAQDRQALPALAVLDFTNVSDDRQVDWLGAGIAETVTSDLAATGRFRVLDRFRVVAATRGTGRSVHEAAAALGARYIVTGSFQRSGSQLRVTARLLDVEAGEVASDAKVDGPLADVFALQDGIGSAFARSLGLAPAARTRPHGRETGNLEAYRAFTEGWLKLESLDTDLVAGAIEDFSRAIALDARYSLAHAGLANARFVAYEMTRITRAPDFDALASGIEHARHAVAIDPALADAHATLSFLLTSAGQVEDARRAAEQAVAIEPDNWRNQYRLGHALWGGARLRALERALALYPQFAYARFEMAMVHVARGDFDEAEDLGRRGIAVQDRAARAHDRFPAIGFHWLLGAIEAARGNAAEAIEEFDREVAQHDPRRLYGPEYAALATVARGHARLEMDDLAGAAADFTHAFDHVSGYARAHLGLAAVHRLDAGAAAARHRDEVRRAIDHLRAHGRVADALYLDICDAAIHEDRDRALSLFASLVSAEPPSFPGWSLPLEPCLGPGGEADWSGPLKALATHAR